MSIGLILDRLIEQRKLTVLPSLFTGDETARNMVVSPAIESVVAWPFPDTEEGVRLGEFRSWLDAFSENGEISVCENPQQKKSRDVMLARVNPIQAEFWSIRVTDPDDTPGIRALGAFVGKDTFVALTWELREYIAGDFDEEVDAVRQAWQHLFGIYTPFSGGSINEYLSNYRLVKADR